MSDYEVATLFVDYFTAVQSRLIDYVSVIAAFVVAGYLLAAKLRLSMAIILVAIFTAYSIDSILVIFHINSDLAGLQSIMASRIASGESDLVFHSGAREVGGSGGGVFGPLRLFAAIGAYLGAVVFFFYQRRIGLEQPARQ